MLSTDDLRKIGDLIDQRLEVKLEQKLEEKLEQKFEQKLAPIRKHITSLKNGQRRLRKDVSVMLKHFDGAHADHEKRIIRIEDHLSLSPLE